MNIATEHEGETTTFRLEGRFDAHEVDAFSELVNAELDEGCVRINVELSAVQFVDSAALAALTSGMKRCRERGGDLTLASPSDPVRVILELTRLDQAFVVAP